MKKAFLTVAILLIALLVSLCGCDLPVDIGDISDGSGMFVTSVNF